MTGEDINASIYSVLWGGKAQEKEYELGQTGRKKRKNKRSKLKEKINVFKKKIKRKNER